MAIPERRTKVTAAQVNWENMAVLQCSGASSMRCLADARRKKLTALKTKSVIASCRMKKLDSFVDDCVDLTL